MGDFIEGAGYATLFSLPVVGLLAIFYKETGSVLASFGWFTAGLWALGLGPISLGAGLAAVTPDVVLPWVILVSVLSWPLVPLGVFTLVGTDSPKEEPPHPIDALVARYGHPNRLTEDEKQAAMRAVAQEFADYSSPKETP